MPPTKRYQDSSDTEQRYKHDKEKVMLLVIRWFGTVVASLATVVAGFTLNYANKLSDAVTSLDKRLTVLQSEHERVKQDIIEIRTDMRLVRNVRNLKEITQ